MRILRLLLPTTLLIAMSSTPTWAGLHLFDGFDAANSAIDGYNGWSAAIDGSDAEAFINSAEEAVLRRNAGGSDGSVQISRPVSALAPLNPVLSSNVTSLNYALQIDSVQFNPGNAFGWAYVVAASDADFIGAGDGYMIWSEATSISGSDTLAFGRYSGGLGARNTTEGWSNATVLITTTFDAGGFSGSDVSIRLHYKPSDDTWTLFANEDGSQDPSTLGASDLLGSTADSTLTSTPLDFLGVGFSFGSATSASSRFLEIDSLSIDLPNAPTAAFLGLGLLVLARSRLSGPSSRRRAVVSPPVVN